MALVLQKSKPRQFKDSTLPPPTGEYTDNENSNKNNKDIYDQKRMCRTLDKTLCYRRGCL